MQPEFSILTFMWSMVAAACFMLALTHLVFLLRGRRQLEYLLAATMAAAAGSNAIIELLLLFATDIPTYQALLKVGNVSIFVMLISLVSFVRAYLGTGSGWLLLLITGLWSVAMIANIWSPASLVFSEISELTRVETFWGESYTMANGVINPWKYCADAASLLILIFLVHATWVAWRQGKRQRAAIVGGSSVLFITLGGIQAPLVDAGILNTPYMVGFAFLAIVAALTYQMISDALRANRYSLEIERLTAAMVLGEVAAGLAHELNQPLSAILSNAQAARRFLDSHDPDLDEIRAILNDIATDDKRAGEIVHGLRAMLGPRQTVSANVDINAAIHFVTKLLSSEIHEKGVTLQMELQSDLAMVLADKVQIQQVLMNLILNALHALADMPSSRRQVVIRSTAHDDSVVVSITDHGPGVRADMMPRLFEPFFSTKSDGLGMGLAICKRIIERHNGTIEIEERGGGGAVFIFTLPAAAHAGSVV